MAKIFVVGLGPGDMSGLPMGTYQMLKSGRPIILRTERHPVVTELAGEGLAFTSLDDLYETGEEFAQVYEDMAARLIQMAEQQGEVVYAVPGHPLMAEQSVQNLYRMAGPSVEIVLGAGHSFLDSVCAALRIDPIEGLMLLDGTNLAVQNLQPNLHTLIVQVYHPTVASDVKLTLMEVYPDHHPVTVVRAAGVSELERVENVPLYELDRLDWIDHLTTVYVAPAAERSPARRRDPWELAELVHILRSPEGCPWDREQTHASLKKYVIEEAYEVAHAIEQEDPEALADELGDLLLQVLLHAEIASETGVFSIRDVFEALSDKLIRRHPHVFGEQTAAGVADANRLWREAKRAEEPPVKPQSLMDQVKWARHPLTVAADIQKQAASVGFDWDSVHGVLEKLKEEVHELETEVMSAAGDADRVAEELGDVAFTLVNVARWLSLDVDNVLSKANEKFAERFRFVEEKIKENPSRAANIGTSDWEEFWKQAKNRAKSTGRPLN
ncbi:MazG family protein [Alicyclobacillus contaminans]|uniref:nucleoside triphosphate pyrophosphohydrolase n=1 Tax=Alicyclobacillus contaminans TaxID=392016 RepID=UPI0005576403|nr:nucleoside triphosphate pyrophosphohydrolase [Alicyclobacillus contaminans]GMA50525.1 MazG family protein [Alicyclobacillus contaminans]